MGPPNNPITGMINTKTEKTVIPITTKEADMHLKTKLMGLQATGVGAWIEIVGCGAV
jgi:hypothetical protein